MASYMTEQKVFFIKTSYCSGGSRIAVDDNIVETFLFLLYHQQTLSTGLLNSLKKQEVRVING